MADETVDEIEQVLKQISFHIRNNNIKEIKKIISQSTDKDILNRESKELSCTYVLIEAIRLRNCAFIEKLIKLGADVNVQRFCDKSTPLHTTSDKKIIKLLVKYGANLNIVNDVGTVLHLTTDIDMIKFFVGLGADVNAVNRAGFTPLCHAILSRFHKNVVVALIELGADINYVCKYGLTAVHLSAGCLLETDCPVTNQMFDDYLNVILDYDVNINVKNCNSYTALMYALGRKLNKNTIKKLLIKGADPRITDRDGKSALMHALFYNCSKDIIELLFEFGAYVDACYSTKLFRYALINKFDKSVILSVIDSIPDINVRFRDGTTCLLSALRKNTDKVVIEKLLKAGADVNIADSAKQTPIMYALMNNCQKEIIDLLLINGADVTAVDKNHTTTLLYALIYLDSIELILKFLKIGVDINTSCIVDILPSNSLHKYIESETPLMYSLRRTGYELSFQVIVEKLLENGASIHITNSRGMNALMYVYRFKLDVTMADLLVRFKSNVYDFKKGNVILPISPLMIAIRDADYTDDCIEKLLEIGSDVCKTDSKGKTALTWALQEKRSEKIIRKLLLYSPKVIECGTESVVTDAVRNNYDKDVIIQLIEKGADVNRLDSKRRSPLMYAVLFKAQKELLMTLVNRGANVRDQDFSGNTVLHFVKESWTVDFFISMKMPVNLKNKFNVTPLMSAVINRQPVEVIDSLLRNGADPNCTDTHLNTPLHYDISCYVDSLIWYGADINLENGSCRTPLWQSLDTAMKCQNIGSDSREGDTYCTYTIPNNDSDLWYAALNYTYRFPLLLIGYNMLINRQYFITDEFKKNLCGCKIIKIGSFYEFINLCMEELKIMKMQYIIKDKLSILDFCLSTKSINNYDPIFRIDKFLTLKELKKTLPVYYKTIKFKIKKLIEENEKRKKLDAYCFCKIRLFSSSPLQSSVKNSVKRTPVQQTELKNVKYRCSKIIVEDNNNNSDHLFQESVELNCYCVDYVLQYLTCRQLLNVILASL